MDKLTLLNVPLITPDLLEFNLEIPAPLRPILDANRHLIKRFHAAVLNAVKESLEHPDTRMRKVTQREVLSRAKLCYAAVHILYFEEKVSLIQSMDLLSGVLIDTLRNGYTAGELTDGRGQTDQRHRWGVAGSQSEVVADMATDLNTGD